MNSDKVLDAIEELAGIPRSKVLNLYLWGSRFFGRHYLIQGTSTDISDWDFLCVVSEWDRADPKYWRDQGYAIQEGDSVEAIWKAVSFSNVLEKDNIDVALYQKDQWERLIAEHHIWVRAHSHQVLPCLFRPPESVWISKQEYSVAVEPLRLKISCEENGKLNLQVGPRFTE